MREGHCCRGWQKDQERDKRADDKPHTRPHDRFMPITDVILVSLVDDDLSRVGRHAIGGEFVEVRQPLRLHERQRA
jgi:hypothetical protein